MLAPGTSWSEKVRGVHRHAWVMHVLCPILTSRSPCWLPALGSLSFLPSGLLWGPSQLPLQDTSLGGLSDGLTQTGQQFGDCRWESGLWPDPGVP